ncbi:MAG: phage late control D family protein [Lachnospiraceae bacterium]|nr:phage late control D family protein [Lachnospiraceae bacterium]
MNAMTCGDLILVLRDMSLMVTGLEITEEPDQHGWMSAAAVTEEQMKDRLIYEGGESVGLYVVRDGSMQPVFCGILTRMEVSAAGGTCLVRLEAVTESCWMDLDLRNRSFQDTDISSHELIRRLTEGYPDSQVLFAIPDEPMERIAVQYQETDWAFLKRQLAFIGAHVYADSTGQGLRLQAGLLDRPEEAAWDELPFTMIRDTAPADPEKGLKSQLVYEVEACDILPLGAGICFHGKEVYIGKILRNLKDGELLSRYTLHFREGLEAVRFYNPFLSGVSIKGSVSAVRRDRLQVKLETDAVQDCRKQYFFPFSTVAASPDGSGWYCMPKAGDPVRIFFPVSDEREGYAIANVQGESAPAQDSPMGNPDLKDITMPDGKKLKFIKDGLRLSVGEDKGSVTLTNDGNAQITTEADITIGAAMAVYLKTEGIMKVSAGTGIRMESDAGCSICMSDDTVEVQAANIENN